MKDYVGKVCPYCKTEFTEDDDVVICSDCFMPHHKECWIENQGCTTFGCSGTIQSVEHVREKDSASKESDDIKIELLPSEEEAVPEYCPNCGFHHKITDVFCRRCGQRLKD